MTGIFASVLVSVLFASSVGAIPNKDLERYFKDMRKDVLHKLDGLEKSNKDLLNKLQEVEDAIAHEAETHSNQETSFPSNLASLNNRKPGKTKHQFVKTPMSAEMGRVFFRMMTSRKANGGGESETPHHENASSRQPLRTRKNQFVKSPTSGRNSRVFFRMMTSRKANGGGESETPHHENASSRQPLQKRKKISFPSTLAFLYKIKSGKTNNQFVKSQTSGEMDRVLFRMMTSRKGNGGGESETPHHENASSRQPLQKRKNQFVKSQTSGEMDRGLFRMMTSRKGNGNHGIQASSLAGGPVPRSEGTLWHE